MAKTNSGAHFSTNPDNVEEKKPAHHGRGPIVAVIVILVILAVVYFGGVVYFSNYFMPNTTLDGTDVSLESAASVGETLISTKVAGWSQTVEGDGLTLSYTADDIGLAYDGASAASDAIAQQNPWAWPVEISGSRTLTTQDSSTYVSYDADKLSSLVTTAVSDAAGAETTSAAAAITYNEETQQYETSVSALASRIDTDALTSYLDQEISALETAVTLDESVLMDGSSIQNAVDQANALLEPTITLTLAGTTVTTVDASLINQWITIGDDLSVTLNQDAITTWAKGDLSEMTDSYQTERTYTRPDGVTETVVGGAGAYGWSINGEETAQDIYNDITSGTSETLEMPCYSTAYSYNPGGQDWSNHYIDVDISDQHAIFFDTDGTVLWEADIVSGQPSLGHDTTQGVWTITNKESPSTLIGPNDESGNPSWVSNVDFWMGVVGNLMGFHNAPWRSSFGGDIYLYNGSHGCMNLSYDDAEKLYSLCEVGDVVVIHE
ncbi:MAG: L,D-transpeptidase [Tractidigestivibacter sp.]|jgi:lipoprotein-anchoring transpeptidase ErfK/SrfK|uniref:L,D-transpeptidase n=1 Tax=Tractidigestivibacter sp. TaxID=2847320 RepID=UPI003D916AD2